MLPDSQTDVIGKRYLLHELLGRGGMGSVYRATDRLTGQAVALKRVVHWADQVDLTTSYSTTDLRIMLAQEFKMSASLKHPNIIEVLDYGFDDERQPYFTMELLENPQSILDAGQDQPLETQVNLIIQMLQALAYLHRRGILHRDLKPGNVLVVDGQVKVLDFGLSVMRERTDHDDSSGTTVGTLAYMAPEVLIGNPASEAADLYAVGIIAYEIFAGRHPFDTADVGKLVNQVMYAPPDLASLDIETSLTLILDRLLQKSPDQRYNSSSEVIAALSAATHHTLPVETAATRESFLQAARLVGRDEELDRLSTALERAMKGQGSVWLIAGENGVGKSRLVDELRTLAMVKGALVMRGQAVNVGRSPYRMWMPVLRWLCLLTELDDVEAQLIQSIIPDAAGLLKRDLTENASEEIDPEVAQTRILRILEKMLRSQSQPAVIIFEDLHWAGSESLSALAQLSRMLEDLPLLVIGSYRDDEQPDLPKLLPDIPVLKLNRLKQGDIAELSQAILGEAGRQPQVVNLLQRETEGNVFFLIEVVRVLAEDAGQLDQIGRMTLPEHVFAGGVRRIIQRRLSRITPESRILLQVAAVMGRQIDLRLLRVMNPSADLDTWLTECVNAAVLDNQDGQWRFAHDRLRDGVLEDLSVDRRRALHRQVAETIETAYGTASEQTAVLAHHWSGAGDLEKEEFYVTRAGMQSLRSGAYREAIAFFERSLDLLTAPGRPRLDRRGLRQKQIPLKNQLAEAHLGFGAYADARRLYREGLQMCIEINDQKGIAHSLSQLGDVAYALNDYNEARYLYRESLQISQKIGDRAAIAKTLNSLGNVAYELGDHEEARKLYQDSLTLSREIGGQWGMAGALATQLVRAVDNHAEHTQAKRLLEETLALHVQAGNKQGMADSLYNLGLVAYDMKEFEEARRYYDQSLTLRKELGDVPGIAQSYDRMGMLAYEAANFQDAGSYFHEALKAASSVSDIPLILYILIGMARLLSSEGQKIRAFELLAFILYFAESPEKIQDEAERLLFELEGGLPPESVEAAWEKGKGKSFDEAVHEMLRIKAGS